MILSCRLSAIPPHLHIFIQCRLLSSSHQRLSSSGHHLPYPTNAKPTPHQIFLLSPGASQEEIKNRYYELVRHHHPDSAHCQALTPSERHARFQSITAAYDILRGKATATGISPQDPYMAEILRRKRFNEAHLRRRGHHARPEQSLYEASADDRMKDRVLLAVGVITLILGLFPGIFMLPTHSEKQHRSAVSNLRQARTEARELGEERRNEVRKLARDIRRQSECNNRGAAND
ncbi:hypothetical protein E4T56_gene15331 [Termitomyces sp. T112]|nr:hypothetical protein E4T56_gene15331 [Termitomyces sp. T112]